MTFRSISNIRRYILISTFLLSTSLFAADYRLGHGYPVDSSVAHAAEYFAQEVKKRTNGAVNITIYPTRQLGTDEQMMRDLSRGLLDFSFANYTTATGLEPRLDVVMLPYLATNYNEVDHYFYGDNLLPNTIKNLLQKMNIRTLGWFEQEFRAVFNSKRPIHKIDELRGLKLRVPSVHMLTNFFDAVGVQTVAMSVSEMYTALEQKAVDGQENGPMQSYDAKLYESTPYLTLTNHSFVTGGILMSKALEGKIDNTSLAIIEKVAQEAQKLQVTESRKRVKESIQHLRNNGVQIVELNSDEMTKARKIGIAIWDKQKEKYGTKLIEALKAKIHINNN